MDWKQLIDSFLEINSQINLSAIRDADGVQKKHIDDALELTKIFRIRSGVTVCDLGTGGGFPLLPLAITHPKTQFVGMDSIKKKISAVQQIIDRLDPKIENIKLIVSRGEDYKGEPFDIVVSRAVAYINELIKYSINLVKPGGYLILYKMYSSDEAKDIEKVCKKYRFSIRKEHRYTLFPGDIERVIYILLKKPTKQSIINNQ